MPNNCYQSKSGNFPPEVSVTGKKDETHQMSYQINPKVFGFNPLW